MTFLGFGGRRGSSDGAHGAVLHLLEQHDKKIAELQATIASNRAMLAKEQRERLRVLRRDQSARHAP